MDLSKVHRLPDDLVNKIAAGEVVERPASVVKELLENALDAGARNVAVAIEAGGKSLVRVTDDGHGMGREDAEQALERHATSKLRELSDLQSIATHGFRGEALPSIASVAHLVLRTRETDAGFGTEVEVRHGRLVHVREAGHPRGTTVEVRDLFGDVPARRKFLRADSTEAGHVAEAVALLALARPDVGFRLSSGRRSLLDAPPVAGLAERIYQVYGRDRLEQMLPVDAESEGARVWGFVSRPDRPLPPRPSLRLFVNGRPVRDRALSKAVMEGYRRAGAGERRPEAFVFVAVPLHMVDVNVHPAKTEVRFADARGTFAAVERAVADGLAAVRTGGPRPALEAAGRVREAVESYVAGRGERAGAGWGSRGQSRRHDAGAGTIEDVARASEPLATRTEPPAEARLLPDALRVLGQHRNTYLVVSDGEDLVLVDQHTAHERVRFEAIVSGLESRSVECQRLLTPLVVPLGPELLALVEEKQASLVSVGFEIEDFGGGSVRLSAVPAVIGGRDPSRTLEAVLRDLLDRESGRWAVSGERERLAATLACHSAVRAGEPLGLERMGAIVTALGRTQHPLLCPHGRPTMVRLPRDDVSRWFGRSGWRRS